MTKFKTVLNKTWIFAAAVSLIAGSSTIMAFALGSNVPVSTSVNAAPATVAVSENVQNQAVKAEAAAEYTVIDLSKRELKRKDSIKEKLSMLYPGQVEEKYNELIANMTPGEKDISAEQAAAYAAGILKKAYGADFKGYIAQASFSRSSVPNSDYWSVVFYDPAAQDKNQEAIKEYSAMVNSVNGTMQFAGLEYPDSPQTGKNPDDPAWKNRAELAVSRIVPENASISSSKVVSATPSGGVTVVCELSDGSAYSVRLIDEHMEAAAYTYFPHGYDGSQDYKPLTGNGVG